MLVEANRQADRKIGFVPRSRALQIVFIVVVSFLIFANTIGDKFVWDDLDFIIKWEKTRSLDNIPDLLRGSVPPGHEGVYRPIRGVIYAISYHLWGINPVGYRLQAIFVNILCVLLVYFIALELIGRSDIAFLTAMLFAVHPVHVEAIAFTTNTFDLTGAVFFLASFLLYLRWRNGGSRVEIASSVTLAAAAFLTEEPTLVLPLMVLLYELCLRGGVERKPAGSIPYFILFGSFILFRFFVLHLIGRKGYLGGSLYYTMLAMTKVFRKYVDVTVFPIYLSVDHTISAGIRAFTHESQPALAQSIFDLDILISIALILLLIALAIVCLRRRPIVTFAVGWFIIGLLPVSNIIPQASLMCERYLFISSFGFCLLMAIIADDIWHAALQRNKMQAYVVAIVFMLIVAGFALRTVRRNMDWKDSLTLWESAIKDNPESSYSHYNLGVEYGELGREDDAIAQYKKAIASNPFDKWSYLNLGVRFEGQGRFEEAIVEYRKAIEIDANFSQAHYDLGVRYQQDGKGDDATAEYRKAAEIDPGFPYTHYNLGNIYLNRGRPEDAIREYLTAIALKPDYPEAQNNLGIAYFDQGRFDDAIDAYKMAIEGEPTYEQAYSNLGNAYMKKGWVGDAITEYQKALKINPMSASAHRGLGDAYMLQGRETAAKKEYQALLKIS
jgi:protein O-mannosyl-transferase